MRRLSVAALSAGLFHLHLMRARGAENRPAEEARNATSVSAKSASLNEKSLKAAVKSKTCTGASSVANNGFKNWTDTFVPNEQQSNLSWSSASESVVVPLCNEMNCTVPEYDGNYFLTQRARRGQPSIKARSTVEYSLFDPSKSTVFAKGLMAHLNVDFADSYFYTVGIWFIRIGGRFSVRRRASLGEYLNLEYATSDRIDPQRIWVVDYCLDPGMLRDWAKDIFYRQDALVGTPEDRCQFYSSVIGPHVRNSIAPRDSVPSQATSDTGPGGYVATRRACESPK